MGEYVEKMRPDFFERLRRIEEAHARKEMHAVGPDISTLLGDLNERLRNLEVEAWARNEAVDMLSDGFKVAE